VNFDQAVKQGGVFRLARSPAPAMLDSYAAKTGVVVKTLSAARASDKEKFLQVVAASLSLPDHFGENWDALYDCLTDLRLAEHGELWLIDGLDGLARGEADEFSAAVSVFSDAADYWRENGKALTVLIVVQQAELATELTTLAIA
jgi:hypothetical protein